MIQQGEMTIIDAITYRCLKIDNEGYAHLKEYSYMNRADLN